MSYSTFEAYGNQNLRDIVENPPILCPTCNSDPIISTNSIPTSYRCVNRHWWTVLENGEVQLGHIF